MRPSQSHSSKMATTGAPLSRAQATTSSMWSACPCDTRIRSAFGGFFHASGQAGLPRSHGSNSTRRPPGVRTRNVEWPSQVIASRCIDMDSSGLSSLKKDQIPERGARMARREERAYWA